MSGVVICVVVTVTAILAGGSRLGGRAGRVGILMYWLYEIDRIISRTVAYAIVTGLLVGLHAGRVVLVTQVFRFHSTVAVATAALTAAALNPLPRQVPRAIDRRFNRVRYDADQTVSWPQDAINLGSVRDDLAEFISWPWNRLIRRYGSVTATEILV